VEYTIYILVVTSCVVVGSIMILLINIQSIKNNKDIYIIINLQY